MNQILPYSLWLGHCGEGRNYGQILDLGARAIVQLAAEDAPLQPPPQLILCRFPLVDGTGNCAEVVHLAIGTVASLIRSHVPTFLCCGAGMSRAPTIAAAALASIADESPEECLRYLEHYHPSIVTPHFWEEVTGMVGLKALAT